MKSSKIFYKLIFLAQFIFVGNNLKNTLGVSQRYDISRKRNEVYPKNLS